jgi:hypothetical protein
MQSVAPVFVALQSSRQLPVLLAFAHVLSAIAVLLSSIPGWLAGILLLVIGASYAHSRNLPRPEALLLMGDGRFEKVGTGGTALNLHSSSALLGSLVVMRYRDDGAMHSLVLLSDCFVQADDWRRFRRWLIWNANASIRDQGD